MAAYLMENEVGFDPNLIGFPSLFGCMAVVLQTEAGLFGWHIYGSGNIGPRVVEFFRFCRQRPEGGNAVRLYGTCNRQERFGGSRAKWSEEMIEIANGLNFRGPVSGFDLSRSGGIGNESAYAEFERDAGRRRCISRYRRWSEMTSTAGQVSADDSHVRIVPAAGSYAIRSLFTKRDGTDGVDSVAVAGGHGLIDAPEGEHESFTIG